MDHLPLPHNPVVGNLDIPLLCTEDYDQQAFDTYPARKGWTLEQRAKSCIFRREGKIIADLDQIGAFVQTWMYFGLLHTITGTAVKRCDFTRTVGGREYLCSTKLESIVAPWSKELYDQGHSLSRDRFAHKLNHVRFCLQRVSDVMYAVVGQEQSAGNSDSPILLLSLGICVLGEYLTDGFMRVVRELKLGSWTLGMIWRSPRSDPAVPLLQEMKQRGWCKRLLTQFEVEDIDYQLIGRLWFFANMEPPLAHLDHDECSRELCRHQQVDEATYKTAHDPACNCEFKGPDPDTIAELVSEGRTPLVRLTESREMEVIAMDQVVDSGSRKTFVALSHVWADGRGNQDGNQLPECVLIAIQRSVDAAKHPEWDDEPGAPFWMDTLCLPRYPMEMRKKALSRLNVPFQQAYRTLVLDSYLCGYELSQMKEIEILARVSLCQWTSRLWTFPEGRFAKELWIQFADRALELHESMGYAWAVSGLEAIPTTASMHIMDAIVDTYKATLVRRGLDDDGKILEGDEGGLPQAPPSLIALRSAIRTRATSKASDEAICLSQLLHLDPSKIVYSDKSEKMAAFWASMHKVSSGLAFSQASKKLTSKGYHWAPASLMGDYECTEPSWAGPISVRHNLDATATENGLLAALPALTLNVAQGNPLAKQALIKRCSGETGLMARLELRDNAGIWYRCVIMQQWHQDRPLASLVHSATDGELAILLESPLSQAGTESIAGLLVNGETENPLGNKVQVYTHVLVVKCTPIEQEWRAYLEDCAQDLFEATGIDTDEESLNDPEGLPLMLTIAVEDYLAVNQRLISLGKQLHAEAANDDNNEYLIALCVDWMSYFIEMGNYYIFQQIESPIMWCID